MNRPGSELAARFRQVVEAAERARRAEEEERQRRQQAAQSARRQLLDDLGHFGQSIGHLDVQAKSHDEGLTLRFGDRFLHFVPVGESDKVKVEFAGTEEEEHRLYREADLGDRWIWRWRRKGRDERQALFDDGLEELVVRALGLPRPGAAEEVAPATTLEDAVPSKGR